jgi:hypothetical protein
VFVGHLALALGAKRVRPEVPLGWFVAATTLPDLLWPFFLLLGIERVSIVPGATAFTPLVFVSYPWSHSLLLMVLWGMVLAGVARARGVPREAGPLLLGLVVSHWVLDFITHAPDLPLWPGGAERFGLGLWQSIPATLIIEGLVWVTGITLYVGVRRPRDLAGRALFWSLILLATLLWAMSPWNPPPPNPRALALFALFGWTVVPWAAWADRHHEAAPF